jgi:hypothetical protein
MNWKEKIIETYRKELGCKSDSNICWCEVCTNIERIMKATLEEVEKQITNLRHDV